MSRDSVHVFAFIVAGNRGVGKTCLVVRFIDNRFHKGTMPTIGVDFALKSVSLDDPSLGHIVLQIWDMAGENKFRSILPYYVAGTQGILLVFDSTRPSTLKYLNDWLEIAYPYLSEKIPVILISTKHDLPESNNTKIEDIKKFKHKFGIHEYIRTSALDGRGVNGVFRNITEQIAKHKGLL